MIANATVYHTTVTSGSAFTNRVGAFATRQDAIAKAEEIIAGRHYTVERFIDYFVYHIDNGFIFVSW